MPNIADTASPLLGLLTDDELARYGEVARDQASAELHRWWLQVALAVGAVATLSWGIVRWSGLSPQGDCSWRCVGSITGIALVLGYWPWRRVRNWSLWQRHVKAVEIEQTRRGAGTKGRSPLTGAIEGP